MKRLADSKISFRLKSCYFVNKLSAPNNSFKLTTFYNNYIYTNNSTDCNNSNNNRTFCTNNSSRNSNSSNNSSNNNNSGVIISSNENEILLKKKLYNIDNNEEEFHSKDITSNSYSALEDFTESITNGTYSEQVEEELEDMEEEELDEEENTFSNNYNDNNNNNGILNNNSNDEKEYKRVIMKPISNKPIIAIIGKPNVGKSTIFNRIIQSQRQALVEEIPGTTRDRYYGESFLYGREFILIDTGGLIGEPKDEGEKDKFQEVIHNQAEIAMEEADAILFVLDYKSGITPIDKELARMLRKRKQSLNGKPIYIAVNKADNVKQRLEGFDDLKVQVSRLGFGEPMAFSALHGDGVHQMFETILSKFPYMDLSNERIEQDIGPGPIRISIVGQPNAGKSSLLNKIIDEQRSIVSEVPGTTHDPVDCNFLWRDKHELCLIDTAGIRRRSTHKIGLEKSSVLWALKSIEKSHVVFLVIDATIGVTEQDMKIASFIMENRKSCIILINKWDLYLKNKKTREELSDQLFFHNFQKQNTTSLSQYAAFTDANIESSKFTYKSLLEDLLAENKKNTKTDDNILGTNKKKSSLLDEKRNKKNKKNHQDLQEDEEDEEQEENKGKIKSTHSSDLDYSNIYWPESNKSNKKDVIEQEDDEEYDFDIDEILTDFKKKQNTTTPSESNDQIIDDDEKFDKAYVEYLKRREEREESIRNQENENSAYKRPPPPEINLPKLTKEQKLYEKELRSKLSFLDFVPVLFTSAKTGFCIPSAMDLAIKVFFEREKRLKINQLLQIIRDATFKHKFPKKGKNSFKLKYAIQTKQFPPTFVFWVNNPDDVEPSIIRYLLKSIREFYPFVGTPIYIKFRKNKKATTKPKFRNNSGYKKNFKKYKV